MPDVFFVLDVTRVVEATEQNWGGLGMFGWKEGERKKEGKKERKEGRKKERRKRIAAGKGDHVKPTFFAAFPSFPLPPGAV